MKVIEFTYIKIFQCFCITLVIYMTYKQFLEYQKNEDSSSVSYRNFNQDERDVYPSFSICLHSTKGSILKSKFSNRGRNEIDKFHKMLIGRENLDKSFKQANYEDNAIDIVEEFFDMFVTYTKKGEQFFTWQRKMNDKIKVPFYKSYQDPYFHCITKSVKLSKHQSIHYDYLVLNANKLHEFTKNVLTYDDTTNLFIYVHHPGQLVREFGKQTFQLNSLDFEAALNGSHNHQEIHITQVEVIRKRADGVMKCNPELQNEDHEWVVNAVRSVGCIPKFWKKIYSSRADAVPILAECNSSLHYDTIHKHFLPPNNFETVAKKYTNPCNQMKITTNLMQKDMINTENTIVLAFNYKSEEYRETLNHRAFGLKSLWSQIGGFFGIFLGYGLMQVPGQLKDFIISIKNEYQKRNEQSTKKIDGETLLPTNGIHYDRNQSYLKSFTQAKDAAPRKDNKEPTSNDYEVDAKLLDNNSSISSSIIDNIRQEFRDEMKKCEDANRVEHEKLKTKLTNLEMCLLTMDCQGIRKENMICTDFYCPTCGTQKKRISSRKKYNFVSTEKRDSYPLAVGNEKQLRLEWI